MSVPDLHTSFADRPSLESLEWFVMRRVLAGFAVTDLGAVRIEALEPCRALPTLLLRQRVIVEAIAEIRENGAMVPGGDEPIGEALRVVDAGSDSPGTALLRLARLLETAVTAAERLLAGRRGLFSSFSSGEEAGPDATSALAAGTVELDLPCWRELAGRIHSVLGPRGEVRPDASAELRRLAVQTRRERATRDEAFGLYVQDHHDVLGEETVSPRSGRLTVLLAASHRGKVNGLSHGRSGSGQSIYFEPLELIDGNNRVVELEFAEAAERHRVVAELVALMRERRSELERAVVLVTELDIVQAAAGFAFAVGATIPEVAEGAPLRLVRARHPLLDPALRAMRQRVLSMAGHTGDVVPLDLDSGEQRAIVLTGPNAGGKTVALKTVGLFVLLAHCGWPVPAHADTSLPFLRGLVAAVGDEQSLFEDRSTFSARLIRCRDAWNRASPDVLVLLDELGSGTNPEEGAALAVSLLEHLVAQGAFAVLTTHLMPVALAAQNLPGACGFALELDAGSGQPTFRPRPGGLGSSHAIDLARRLELPSAWVKRAEIILGEEHRALRELIADAERERQGAAQERARVERLAAEQAVAAARLQAELDAAREQRKAQKLRFEGELAAFRREARRRLSEELEEHKARLEPVTRAAASRLVQRVVDAARVPSMDLEDEVRAAGPLVQGAAVSHQGLGWHGNLVEIDGDRAAVMVGGKKLLCSLAELRSLELESPPTPAKRGWGQRRTAEVDAAPPLAELKLLGATVEEALEQLDSYLDRALLAGLDRVRVIHGHGTGRLREGVRDFLRTHPAGLRWEAAPPEQGGNGATIVNLDFLDR